MLDLNSRIKELHWWDIAFVKLSVFAFALMIAKLWTPILGLAWWWYLIIAVAASALPLRHAVRN